MFDLIADQLGDGPWLLGERFSAADLPQLASHARRVLARPAVQAAFAAEGLGEPFI